MNKTHIVSRRKFMGGMAAAAGFLGLQPGASLLAQSAAAESTPGRPMASPDDYDAYAKLCFNENPYGPPESVVKAMTGAFKYANRYGYPDGGIQEAIASHHGVSTENVLLGAGSTEILDAADAAFLDDHKRVIGVQPTFGSVYEYALGLKANSIKLPLLADYRQDIPAMIKATKDNHPNVGLVYLCNPNNPTGAIVTKQEVKQLLDGLPADVPVLIDEAYHHFVEDPDYATSVPYVKEGRPVVIARTFSKIVGLAGMRLGYAVASTTLIEQMRPHVSNMSINALVKWGAAAGLKDTAAQEHVKQLTITLRKKTTTELESLGYPVIPSQANFFMVNIRQPVSGVGQEFRKRGVLVGRPFPPMNDHLRVSVGSAEEMDRFMAAFKEIVVAGKTKTAAKTG